MESLWQQASAMPRFPKLSRDIGTDVLVIGGGMAGLLTAYLLQRQGIRTVVVETNRIYATTTAHTTAKITAQHGLLSHKLLQAYGKTYAQMYYRVNGDKKNIGRHLP